MPATLIESTQLEALLLLAEHSDERELLAVATRSVVALLGDRGSAILLDGGPRVAFSTNAPKLDLSVDVTRYPEIHQAVAEQQPVVIEDVHADERLATVRTLLPKFVRSVAVVPMVRAGRTVGVFHVQSTEQRPIPEHALPTAKLIGMLISTLLDNVRLRSRVGPDDPFLEDESTSVEVAIDQFSMRGGDAVPIAIDLPERTDRIGEPARLLLVEDDPDQAETVTTLLELEGYVVTVATTGPEGLHHARTATPNLILLDVGLPLLDGYDVARHLAEDELTCDIPILFLSAAEDLMHRVRQLKLGAVDFLAKPYQLDALLARVERALNEVELRARLRSASYLDELTGLNNLRYLHERMVVEQARAQRYGISLAAVMLDVDKLKQVNDVHGHAAGSELLAAIGQVLRDGIRETDVAVRYGGDEFVVLLPHATLVEAMAFGERVLLQLRKLQLPFEIRASASIGVAAWKAGGPPLETLLEQADGAAYESKRRGGNCVSAAAMSPAA